MSSVKKGFIAEGTTCASCEKIIKKQARKVDGVKEVTFNLSSEVGYVTFDNEKTSIDEILHKIEEKNYVCYILDEKSTVKKNNTMAWIIGVAGLVLVGYFLFGVIEGIPMPTLDQNMSLGLLFVVGLLTGFHCVSMCGGFVVSYTAKHAQEGTSSYRSHIAYGMGKTLSYTLIGAAFGLVGSLIAFTPMMRGVAGIVAGLFLVLFGLNMLNVFPILRKFSLRTPRFVGKFVGKESQKHSSPLVIGLLNGLMIACGPLQAIYIMAAGTGSPLEGAKILFIFGLGTLPVLLGFGYLTSFLSTKATHKILKASGILVIILGVVMFNRGLSLSGSGLDANTLLTSVSASPQLGNSPTENILVLENGYQVIEMTVDRYGWTPDTFVLKKGVPVKWKINGKEINGCNNAIQVPAYGLQFDIKPGMQEIEFTPTENGVISWSCWMGMIPGTFIVTDDLDTSNTAQIKQTLDAIPSPQGGSCGRGSGGCGCGGSA